MYIKIVYFVVFLLPGIAAELSHIPPKPRDIPQEPTNDVAQKQYGTLTEQHQREEEEPPRPEPGNNGMGGEEVDGLSDTSDEPQGKADERQGEVDSSDEEGARGSSEGEEDDGEGGHGEGAAAPPAALVSKLDSQQGKPK